MKGKEEKFEENQRKFKKFNNQTPKLGKKNTSKYS